MIFAGIDAGSRALKIVLFDAERDDPVAARVVDQGVKQEELASELLDAIVVDHGLSREDIGRVTATGYGRHNIGFADKAVTEISCHARGARRLVPDARTVVDIGGQDSKLIRLDENGGVQDFSMNDRCAAGTGCFLEVVARRLGLSIEELGHIAAKSVAPATISSTCVVFADTEIVGLLAAGTPPQDIVAGVQAAICSRIAAMAGRAPEGPVAFTGGVALIPGMTQALQAALGVPVTVAPTPQLAGALGAALIAAQV